MFNHLNHLELKNYKYPECTGKAHEGEVRALVFVEEYTLLISGSSDRSIAIHDDSKVGTTTAVLQGDNSCGNSVTVVDEPPISRLLYSCSQVDRASIGSGQCLLPSFLLA